VGDNRAVVPYHEIGFASIAGLEDYECTPGGADERVLTNLERINIFAGKNNSGKSRFLRALFRADEIEFNSSEAKAKVLADAAGPVQEVLHGALTTPTSPRAGIVAYAGFNATYLDDVVPGRFLPGARAGAMLRLLREKLQPLTRDLSQMSLPTQWQGRLPTSPDALAHQIHERVRDAAIEALRQLDGVSVSVGEEVRFYVPVLRGLRPVAPDFNDVYSARTIADYDIKSSEGRVVFTGLGSYQQVELLKLGSPEQREAIEEYERFLSLEFFEGARVQLTPRRGRDVVHIRVGSGRDYPIYSLGDGVQAMIVLTFAAFTANSRAVFFIEEPEQHLHPGFQRRIMDLYARSNVMSRHQYFITTHSNHLLDMATESSEWSAYLFRRHHHKDRTEIIPFPGARKLALRELGARATSVMLTNASVWVEGVTDRLYVRAFLRRYMEEVGREDELREDTHYSLIEYGGANITHWEFNDTNEFSDGISVASICSRSMVIADGDVAGKGDRVTRLTEALGENFVVLPCKEIENLLPEEVVRVSVSKWVEDADLQRIRGEEYQSSQVGLGSYLDSVLKMSRFAEPSGTIKSKVAFCQKAVDAMGAIEWSLPPGAKDLCRRIVAFVDSANRE
jgi:hypothetical protein